MKLTEQRQKAAAAVLEAGIAAGHDPMRLVADVWLAIREPLRSVPETKGERERRRQEVIRRLEFGDVRREIADDVGLSPSSVSDIARAAGLPPAKRGIRPGSRPKSERRLEVERRIGGGEAIADIARAVGLTIERVRQIAVKMGSVERPESALLKERHAHAEARRQAAKSARASIEAENSARKEKIGAAVLMRRARALWANIGKPVGMRQASVTALVLRYHPELRTKPRVRRWAKRPIEQSESEARP